MHMHDHHVAYTGEIRCITHKHVGGVAKISVEKLGGVFRPHCVTPDALMKTRLVVAMVAMFATAKTADGPAGGIRLVTRDRADHHPTEISYIYTFFAHMSHTCTIIMFAYTDWHAFYHTETCRTDE